MNERLLNEIKVIREETDFTEVNYLLSKKWKLLKIVTEKKSFKYVLGKIRKVDC